MGALFRFVLGSRFGFILLVLRTWRGGVFLGGFWEGCLEVVFGVMG